MKIAYYCDEYPPAPHGGIGTFTHTIAHGMVEAGHEVTVVGFGEKAQEWYDGEVRVVSLPRARVPRLTWLVNRLRLHRWLAREVASGRIHLVEIPEFAGSLPLPFRQCPVVVRLHLSASTIARSAGRKPNLALWVSEKATLRIHRNWIAVSEHAQHLTQETFHLVPALSAVIYHPVTLSGAAACLALRTLPERFVLYAGTVSARKGAYLVAEAAKHFLRAEPRTDLVYAGAVAVDNGTRADERITQIVGPGLAHRVHFLGWVDGATVAAGMRRASVLVFPSNLETFGLVVAEAMLCGTPVVVPDAPPFDEYVEHMVTGIRVPGGNAHAVAAATELLLADARRARQIGNNARCAVARRFNLQKCVESTLQFYTQCITGHRGARPSPVAVANSRDSSEV